MYKLAKSLQFTSVVRWSSFVYIPLLNIPFMIFQIEEVEEFDDDEAAEDEDVEEIVDDEEADEPATEEVRVVFGKIDKQKKTL